MQKKKKTHNNDERRQNATLTFKKYLQQHLESTEQVQKSYWSNNMFCEWDRTGVNFVLETTV